MFRIFEYGGFFIVVLIIYVWLYLLVYIVVFD